MPFGATAAPFSSAIVKPAFEDFHSPDRACAVSYHAWNAHEQVGRHKHKKHHGDHAFM